MSQSQRNFNLLKKGDPTALANIHSIYSRGLFWVGKGMISDEFVIETLIQDAFLKLWTLRENIETPEHIFYFLRYVVKRECTYFYCRPKNKFYRSINRLEFYGNYQDYMLGHDPEAEEDEHLLDQQANQKALDKIKKVLPFLNAERRHLIELCLKYGFQYKAIAEVRGTGITETSNEVKRTIEELKNIIHQGNSLGQHNSVTPIKLEGAMTEEQSIIFKLRLEQQFSFATIAKELNLSQKEVHKQFMTAYKFMQRNHEQQLESA